MGGSSGATTSQSQASASDPWAPQQSYELAGFKQAASNLQNEQNIGPYTGQFQAPGTPGQTAAIGQAGNYASGPGANLANSTALSSQPLLASGGMYMNNASGMATNGAPIEPGLGVLSGYANGTTPASYINPALSSALNTAGVNGANALTGFQAGQQGILSKALSDPTAQLTGDASTIMGSSPVQSAISNTNAQLQQQLNEITNPSFNRQAAEGGDLNSSRAGMGEALNNEAEGIAQGNADASLENNAFNTALGTAANTYTSGLNTGAWDANFGANGANTAAEGAAGTELGQSEFGTNTALTAANSGINANLNNANLEMGANGQLGNAFGLGLTGASTAGNIAGTNFNLGAGAGGLQQTLNQVPLTNAYDTWAMNTGFPSQALNSYWGIAGAPLGYDNTSSGQVVQNQSPISNIAGLGAAGASLFANGGAFYPGDTTTNSNGTTTTTSPGGLYSALQGLFGGSGGSADSSSGSFDPFSDNTMSGY